MDRATVQVLRSTARRCFLLNAAELLCAWSHHGRLRSEAAFAALAGVAPLPTSSRQTVRYRLNRAGDCQLNWALHTIVLSRLTHHAETRAYATRRARDRKTLREIKRCLKRHLARRLFKLLKAWTSTTTPGASAWCDCVPDAAWRSGVLSHRNLPETWTSTCLRTPSRPSGQCFTDRTNPSGHNQPRRREWRVTRRIVAKRLDWLPAEPPLRPIFPHQSHRS